MNRSDQHDRLVRLILGADAELTAEEATERGGLSLEDGRRLWRALGFPDVGEGVAYADADVHAIKLVAAALHADLLGEETVFRMTRALGTTMSRLADWQVSTLVEQVEHDVAAGKAESRLERAVELTQYAAPGFESLMLYAWRRHLAAAIGRMEALGSSDEELLSTHLTVGFADLSRFTTVSNGLDGPALGNLVEDFESRCTDVVTAGGGRIIKTLGDAVLFVADTAPDGHPHRAGAGRSDRASSRHAGHQGGPRDRFGAEPAGRRVRAAGQSRCTTDPRGPQQPGAGR